MAIKHTRVSGVTVIDPEDINGKDWDDPHVYSAGSIFPVAVFSVGWMSEFVSYVSARCTASRLAVGNYLVAVDITGLPLGINTEGRFFVTMDGSPPNPAPGLAHAYTWQPSLGGGEIEISISLYDPGTSDGGEPSDFWFGRGTLWCEVVATG
jgi:hypothetical protein